MQRLVMSGYADVMKASHTCPKCASTKLYVVSEVRQPAHDSLNGVHPMNVTTASCAASDLGISDDNSYRAAIGSFEAWICAQCGLTEWYAKDVSKALEKLARKDPRLVRVVDRPQSPPFR